MQVPLYLQGFLCHCRLVREKKLYQRLAVAGLPASVRRPLRARRAEHTSGWGRRLGDARARVFVSRPHPTQYCPLVCDTGGEGAYALPIEGAGVGAGDLPASATSVPYPASNPASGVLMTPTPIVASQTSDSLSLVTYLRPLDAADKQRRGDAGYRRRPVAGIIIFKFTMLPASNCRRPASSGSRN